VLRGSAFVFGKYDVKDEHRWSTSRDGQLFNPFSPGRHPWRFSTGKSASSKACPHRLHGRWLTPFGCPAACFALGLFAFLASTYLTLDTRTNPPCRDSPALLVVRAGTGAHCPGGFLTSHKAHRDVSRIDTLVGAGAAGVTSLFACAALICPLVATLRGARLAAFGQVTLIYVGWGLAQYPIWLR